MPTATVDTPAPSMVQFKLATWNPELQGCAARYMDALLHGAAPGDPSVQLQRAGRSPTLVPGSAKTCTWEGKSVFLAPPALHEVFCRLHGHRLQLGPPASNGTISAPHVPVRFAGHPVRQWFRGVLRHRSGSLGSSGAALVAPVVSKTSISVHVVPLLVWNHHELETPLEPLRQRASKYPPRTLARLRTAAVV